MSSGSVCVANPRKRVGIIAGPVHKLGARTENKRRVQGCWGVVVSTEHYNASHEFSGDSASIGVRAHSRGDPKLIVCDEPVSALDVSCRRRSSTC